MSNKKFSEIKNVAVVGAGTMGAAIAQHFMLKGLAVTLLDLSEESLEKGRASIDGSLSEAVERNILSPEKKNALLANLRLTTNYAHLSNCQFVVEAVFEDFGIKQKVFKAVENEVAPDCIIASNTSSFSITELGSVLNDQSRFVGVHYFYHAAKNKLVEVIPGANTDAGQVTRLVDFYYDHDKAPIVVADKHGFAVNRFFVPWLIEATRLLEEGLGSIDFIDRVAVENFKVGMGPFALMNATGVPIALHAANTLAAAFGPMYAPPAILATQVEKGEDWDCTSTECLNGGADNEEEVKSRLLAMSLGVACQMVSEEVCSVTDADLGARLGLRWPMGPFELINEIGVEFMEKAVAKAFGAWGEALPAIFKTVDPAKGFEVEHVKAHVVGDAGVIEFNRPDAMNALNENVVNQLAAAFDGLDANPALTKIVFFGRGKAFVAGADIKFFVDNINGKDLERTYQFTVEGQELLSRISSSDKTTIAYLDGMALGGGLELALACDHRIGTKKLVAAFPETGIGIYPGLGGTQRTTRLLGKGLSKYLVATGSFANADQALQYGLVDSLTESKSSLEEIAALAPEATPQKTPTEQSEIFVGFTGDADDPAVAAYSKVLKKKAPIALKKSMQLIDDGADLDLQAALKLELDGLYDIFSTKDALDGLSSVIERRKPSFTGE